MTTISDSKDTKITLRISDEDLDEIDSFLDDNSSFGNRSEFLRNCALDFIHNKRAYHKQESNNSISLSKKQEEFIERMIKNGYYSNREDAIRSIIEYIFDSGFIRKIFEDKIEKYQEIERSMNSNEKMSLRGEENERKFGRF
jgi:Arc/MetJ-type ribon-helix-helix transcriptional regulator